MNGYGCSGGGGEVKNELAKMKDEEGQLRQMSFFAFSCLCE